MSKVNDFAGQNYIYFFLFFIWGQKLSHWFVLVCVCVCSSRTRAINIYAVWQGERKNIWCYWNWLKKHWSQATATYTHTHTHNHTRTHAHSKMSGLPVKNSCGMSESLTTTHLGINPHTHISTERIHSASWSKQPFNKTCTFKLAHWFQKQLPGLSAPRLSQRVRGASQRCADFNKASRTLTRQATPSACDRPSTTHTLDPLWIQVLFISPQCNFRISHRARQITTCQEYSRLNTYRQHNMTFGHILL